jgi:hypothetical protein
MQTQTIRTMGEELVRDPRTGICTFKLAEQVDRVPAVISPKVRPSYWARCLRD